MVGDRGTKKTVPVWLCSFCSPSDVLHAHVGGMDTGINDSGVEVEVGQHQAQGEYIEPVSSTVQESSETWEDIYLDDLQDDKVSIALVFVI